jgi:nucleotide-binding universal stress UspA family protein
VHARAAAGFQQSQWLREWRDKTTEDLHHEVMRIQLAGVEARAVFSPEDPVRLLKRVAAEAGVECIVVPDDSGGALHEAFVGSIAGRLKRRCPVPLVVVRGGQ